MKKEIKSIILILLILCSLILENSGLSSLVGPAYSYIIKPMFWIFLGIITLVFFKNEIIVNKKYKSSVTFVIVIAILSYLIIYFGLGYINGFAYNPYNNSIKGILLNLWMFIPMLLVKEYIRYYLINNNSKKNILWWTLIISLVLTFVEINIFDVNFETTLSIIKFVMESFFPTLIVNLFLSYVCFYGEYHISILYVLIPKFLTYILPILPDLDLPVLAILNTTIPFFSYMYLNHMINKMDKTLNREVKTKVIGPKGVIFMIAFIILIISLGIGVFPYQPLVIASDSMAPKILKGDIVIIKDTNVKEVKIGEIIRYKLDNYYVVHRVTNIKEDQNGNKIFITKGDNNAEVDLYPVLENQFAGTIKFKISWLGWPTLIFREIINNGVDDKVTIDRGRTS